MPPKKTKKKGKGNLKVPEEEKPEEEEEEEEEETEAVPKPLGISVDDDSDEDEEEDPQMKAARKRQADMEAALDKTVKRRKTDETGADAEAPAPAPVKKKAGRPPGAGNKPKPGVKKGKAKAAGTGTKARFNAMEDLLLCRAYVSVSEDAAKGANMKSADFWKAVLEKFRYLCQQAKLENYERLVANSLETRWRTHIMRSVNKFNGYFRQVNNEKKSGWSEDDYMNKAIEEYQAVEGEFKFKECLPTLWACPKFDPMLQPIDVDAPDGEGAHNEISAAMGAKMSRPMGSKAAKKIQVEEKTSYTLKKESNAHMEKMSANSEVMARAVSLRQLNDSDWKSIEFLKAIGNNDEAMSVFNRIQERNKSQEEWLAKRNEEMEENRLRRASLDSVASETTGQDESRPGSRNSIGLLQAAAAATLEGAATAVADSHLGNEMNEGEYTGLHSEEDEVNDDSSMDTNELVIRIAANQTGV